MEKVLLDRCMANLLRSIGLGKTSNTTLLSSLLSAEMGTQTPWKEPCIWSAWQNIEKPRRHKIA